MTKLLLYIKFLMGLPSEIRFFIIRREIQIQIYRLWRKVRGKPFKYPICNGKPGTRYRVTKSIPGIGLNLFGRTFCIIVPVILEQEPME
jgi:hypothetical protein